MDKSIEIINIIDINEEMVIIVAKKIKKEPMRCKHCNAMKNIEGMNEKFCVLHKAFVTPEDICIEEGM